MYPCIANILSNGAPKGELNKRIKKNWVNLKFNAEGYYCDECMKVISIFDGKYTASIIKQG